MALKFPIIHVVKTLYRPFSIIWGACIAIFGFLAKYCPVLTASSINVICAVIIFILLALSISLLYLVFRIFNDPSFKTDNNCPDKLSNILRNLSKIEYFNTKIIYKLTFKKITKGKLWVHFEFTQKSFNNSNHTLSRYLLFPFFSKETKNAKAFIDGREYFFKGKESAHNNQGYQIDADVMAFSPITFEFFADVEYDLNDSELLQTYKYCDEMEVDIVDEVSCIQLNKLYIVFEALHTYKAIEDQVKIISDNTYKITLTKGLLPYQGVYLKWRKYE